MSRNTHHGSSSRPPISSPNPIAASGPRNHLGRAFSVSGSVILQSAEANKNKTTDVAALTAYRYHNDLMPRLSANPITNPNRATSRMAKTARFHPKPLLGDTIYLLSVDRIPSRCGEGLSRITYHESLLTSSLSLRTCTARSTGRSGCSDSGRSRGPASAGRRCTGPGRPGRRRCIRRTCRG